MPSARSWHSAKSPHPALIRWHRTVTNSHHPHTRTHAVPPRHIRTLRRRTAAVALRPCCPASAPRLRSAAPPPGPLHSAGALPARRRPTFAVGHAGPAGRAPRCRWTPPQPCAAGQAAPQELPGAPHGPELLAVRAPRQRPCRSCHAAGPAGSTGGLPPLRRCSASSPGSRRFASTPTHPAPFFSLLSVD